MQSDAERKVATPPQHDLIRSVGRHISAALVLLLVFLAASAAWLSAVGTSH